MVIENQSSQPREVVSVSSDLAEKAEMHEMKTIRPEKTGNMGNMAKTAAQPMMVMMPLSGIAVPAKSKTALSPNGIHIMLFGLKSRPAEGEKIRVILKLDDGTTVPVSAIVRKQ